MGSIMRKLVILGACLGIAAVAPVQASADCPEPSSEQGVEVSGGTYSVSAQVQVKPVLWVANAGEDTVSKIATDVNKEVARYSSAFWKGGIGGNGAGLPAHDAWTGPAPSRSAVDGDGNAYIANRGFNRVAEVMKILTTGCIDRNNNGKCDTSSDLNNDGKITTNEMYPILDDNSNGIIDDSEIRDERVVWIKRVGTSNEVARALAIDKNGDLWIGMYNTLRFYKMNASTGTVNGNVYIGAAPYGAAVDSKGRLFTAGLGSGYQRRFDTNNANIQASYYIEYGYGMAVGKDHTGVEKVIFAHHNNKGAGVMDPDTLATAYPLNGKGLTSYGISFDKGGNIMLSAGQYYSTTGASKSRTDGSIIWTRPPQAGCATGGQRGAIVDANNDVWIVSVESHRVCKFLADGTPSAQVPVGRYPYTYSDASGIGLQFSDPTGKVTFLSESVGPNFDWSGQPVCFTGSGNVTLAISAANSVADLQFATSVAVPLTQQGAQLCGTVPNGVVGQHLQMTFSIKTGGTLSTTDPTTGECTIDLPEGNAPPVAVCQDVAVCANDQCVASANIDNGSNDPDGDALTMSVSPNGAYGLGQTLVTLSVNDGQATATCQATVTVNDCTAPAIACPAPVVAECTGSSSASASLGGASATDNCGAANVSQVGEASYPLGTTTVAFTASDAAGNSASCSSSVTVVDTTAPAISCPAAFTAECTGNGSASVTPGSAWSADICGAVAVTNPDTASFALGTTTVNYSATDAQGLSATCSSDITVVDTTAPAITCPDTVVAECTGKNSASVTPAPASASDICGAVSISSPAAASFPVGSTSLTYTATDAQGLSSTCSAAVQVVDTTAPAVTAAGAGAMWPPNHKYTTISLADCGIQVADVCNGSMSLAAANAEITCVTSDEVEDANGNGDGNTKQDIVIVNGTTVTLRAEREGTGDGRLYKIGFRVKDASGNFTDGVCTVGTPHDQSAAGSVIVDSGVKYTVCK